MEFGSFTELLSGLGGFAAAIAAFMAWKVNTRMLKVEQERDAEIEELRKRDQASRVFVLGAVLTGRPYEEKWGFYIHNGSDRPLFDFEIYSQRVDGSRVNAPLKYTHLPPGTFAVPSHPERAWGELVHLDREPEPVSPLIRLRGDKKMVTHVTFMDSEGTRWKLQNGVQLEPEPDVSNQIAEASTNKRL